MVNEFRLGHANRIIINPEGEGWPPSRAKSVGIEPDILFRRADGWTVGAPACFESVAYNLWPDDWILFGRRGDTYYQGIRHYKSPSFDTMTRRDEDSGSKSGGDHGA